MTVGTIVDLLDPDINCPLVIQEGESQNIEGTLVDGSGVAIPLAGLATFTLTLFNEFDLSIINSRTGQDILNTNGGTVNDPASFILRLDAADAVIIDGDTANPKVRGDVEAHIARLFWTWDDGVAERTGIQEIRLRVQKTSVAA